MTRQYPSESLRDIEAVLPTVLVVDDSRAHRRLLSKSLARWGYAAMEAGSGQEAIELCRKRRIDLVVSDWIMPGMSGVEFCRAYRDLMQDQPGYFILLTAQTDREALAEGLDSGADDFLSKPFNAVELKARIRAGERVLKAQHDIVSKNQLLIDTLSELRTAQELMESDLKEARRFQQALVPDRHASFPTLDVNFLYQPSGHVGGDLVGCFPVSDSRIGVYSVDVSGHGIASALMTARIAGLLSATAPERNIALQAEADGTWSMLPVEDVCRRLNTLLLQEPDVDKYLTMSLVEVDLLNRRAMVSQAGHPSTAVQRATGEIEFIDAPGLPIGLIADADYTSFALEFAPGDRCLLYSDGLTECPNSAGILWDEAGLSDSLRRHASLSGEALLDRVRGDLQDFAGFNDFPDDLSAALLEFK